MFEQLSVAEERYQAINDKLMDPNVVSDPKQYAELMKEYKNLTPIVEKYREYTKAKNDMDEAKMMLEESGLDKDFRELIEEQYETSKKDIETISEELKILLIPKDPNDDKNVIVEIRGGAGGQHVNKTESAIRITHIPTGTVVECQDERSQYKNKDKAMKILRSRIYEKMQREQEEKIASERKLQVGAGDRAERIRTYNYPQGRVTDHRIGLTLYKLEQILNGDLTELFDGLNTFDQAEKLKESSNATGSEN